MKVRYTPLLLLLWLILKILPAGATLSVVRWARRHHKYFAWVQS